MLNMSQSRTSRQLRRWAWVHHPLQTLDNPVKRYLGNLSLGNTRRPTVSLRGIGRFTVRPAI